jgi:hypothetical protein
MRKLRKPQFGAVETRRTGTIRLDWTAINKLTKAILDEFIACGPNRARPSRITGLKAPGGQHSSVRIDISPRKIASKGRTTGITRTRMTIDENDAVKTEAIVKISPRAHCASYSFWKGTIRNVLAHELTHAQDRAVVAALKKDKDIKTGDDFCSYVSHPREVAAFLNETRSDLQQVIKEDPHVAARTLPELLKHSWHFGEIEDCVKGENRKRFLKMLARNFTRDSKGRWKTL